MVAIDPAQWDAMRKGKVKLEEMNEMDRLICGADQSKNIKIPLDSVYNLRRIAEILRSVASDFDFLSRRIDVKARTLILETRAIVDDANRQIKDMQGKGKSKKVTLE